MKRVEIRQLALEALMFMEATEETGLRSIAEVFLKSTTK